MPPVRHDFGTTTSIRIAEFDPDTGRVTVETSIRPPETFENFTAELFAEWCAAPKPGQWFTSRIRRFPDRYPVVGGVAPGDTTLAVADEVTVGTAPADGWQNLQPNTLAAPSLPAGAEIVGETHEDGVHTQTIKMPGVATPEIATKIAKREERFGDGEPAPRTARVAPQDKVRAALKRLADRKGE